MTKIAQRSVSLHGIRFFLAAMITALGESRAAPGRGDLLDMSLEQLSNIEITSVSRHAEKLSDAAAAIYVINERDIRNSGAMSLPEALRLAPNLEVARVSTTTYAISARGFNNSLGNKLLVLIDGRTVYTPLFSGVFWDAQDLMLDDVERIEVISGPGATLWGANAVNGVINVITKSASDTQGLLAVAQSETEGRLEALRYGSKIGTDGSFRAYAKHTEVEPSSSPDNEMLSDGWTGNLIGFRADWGTAAQGLRIQGDGYRGRSQARLFGPVEISGMNLLTEWNHVGSDDSTIRVKAYLDRTERKDPLLFRDNMEIVDADFQHRIPLSTHSILWGFGYRRADDTVEKGVLVTFLPNRRIMHWENIFIQDEWSVTQNIAATAGIRMDRNIYTGIEVLPSLRAAWKTSDNKLWWAALSRAVRAPSRIDREFYIPGDPPYIIAGGSKFVSEISKVAELGYRAQPTETISYSITLFHHQHDRLRSGEPQADGTFHVENGTAGRTSGVEAWTTMQLAPGWRVSAGMLELRQKFWTKPGSSDPDDSVDLGNDPRHQWSLRSEFSASRSVEMGLAVRYVGSLPSPPIPSYVAVDLNATWQPNDRLDLSFFIRDALNSAHVEFAPGLLDETSQFGREMSIRARLRW